MSKDVVEILRLLTDIGYLIARATEPPKKDDTESDTKSDTLSP